jgi:O-antigen ligase
MIRLTALWIIVLVVSVYTWKDWFRGLCALVLLVAVLEMPDVPKTVFGIDGLNFFNILLANVVIAWLIARHRENLKWDMPLHVFFLLTIYLAIVLIGFYRLYHDRSYLEDTTSGIIREYLINTIKWAVPGIMLFDGCRTKQRTTEALLAVIGVYVFLALMVIKVMPIRAALMSGSDLQHIALKLLVSRIGLHRVTLSMMLAGASWGLIALGGLTKDKRIHIGTFVGAFVILYSQSLTAGRAGYLTWGMVGLVLAFLRWRGYLLLAPLMGLVIVVLMPSVAERMFEGFIHDQYSSGISVNDVDLTAGRVIIWPLVIAMIKRGMWLGWGRMAMWRTGIVTYVAVVLSDDSFGHPHNAYLEWLLDNGIIGFVPVMLFYAVILFYGMRMFCDKRSGVFMAAGGVSTALVLALLGASFGSQSFYPVEGTVGMWCAIGIMLRVSVQRSNALAAMRAVRAPAGMRLQRPPTPAEAAAAMEAALWPPTEPLFPNAGRPYQPRRRAPARPPVDPAGRPAAAATIIPSPVQTATPPPQRPAARPAVRAASTRFVFSDEDARTADRLSRG